MKSLKPTVKKVTGTSVPLAVLGFEEGICMLEKEEGKTASTLHLSWSKDGVDFERDPKKVTLKIGTTKKEKIENCKNFFLSRTPTSYLLSYTRVAEKSTKKTKKKGEGVIVVARSRDLYEWKVVSELPALSGERSALMYNKELGEFELYRDGAFVRHQATKTLTVWKTPPSLAFTSRHGQFDQGSISIIGSILTLGGILVLYDASVVQGNGTLLQAGAVLFDVHNPKHIIWRSDGPLWQGVVENKNTKKPVQMSPLGFVEHAGSFLIYWLAQDGTLLTATIPALFKEVAHIHHPKVFKRFKGNPIIEPREAHEWEAEGTFNPAAFADDDGIIHLLYRAIGRDGISRVGYARSKDGTHFNGRLPYPVFEPSRGFGMPDPSRATGPVGYHPAMYTSGGGWGGSEDPRAVKIGKWIYMIYVAFEGWGSVRMALTAITVEDFLHGRWHWKKPTLISPPGEVNKNWLLFPEKIHGKFAILHTLAPDVGVEYLDNLLDIKTYIKSNRPGGPQPGRPGFWDSKMRGAGAPPIKTSLGWLLLYHAIDNREPSKYKLGAMILDKDDPTKVLHRSSHPILSPDMPYENEGKPGVVYASGAVLRGDELYIYYGGGDHVVCVASTPIKDFLHYLVTGKPDSYTLERRSVAVA